MSPDPQQANAEQYVRERFDWLDAQFEEFYNQYERPVCVFAVDPLEKRLVDGLHKRENTEHKKWTSLFLRLTTPFAFADVYLEQCHAELEAISKAADQDYFEPEAIGRDFVLPASFSSPRDLVVAVKAFAADFAMFPDELVLFLDPRQVADAPAWSMFCDDVVSAMEEGDKLLLCDHRGRGHLEGFLGARPDVVWPIDVACDFSNLSLDPAPGAGGEEGPDPAVRYRDLEGQMRMHAQKGRRDEAIQFGEDALAVTQSNEGWDHLEIALELEMGFMHVEWGERDAAEMRLDRAVNKAEALLESVPAVGLVSVWQACQTRAAACIHWGEFDDALSDYRRAAEVIEGNEEMMLQRMEVLRMVAECEERTGNHKAAFKALKEAMACAAQCDPQALPYTSLALIGVTLQELAGARGDAATIEEVEMFNVECLGPGWQDRANRDGR